MKNQTLVKRYIQGLINSIQNDKEFLAINKELFEFNHILENQEELKNILLSPFFSSPKKIKIVKEILKKKAFHEKTIRFVTLLLENERLKLFSSIMDHLTEEWNEKKRISTFEVASVIPLTKIQKRKLKKKLETMEKASVILKYKIDPELIGGLKIRRKNIIYDVSIEGNLSRIKEKIFEGKD